MLQPVRLVVIPGASNTPTPDDPFLVPRRKLELLIPRTPSPTYQLGQVLLGVNGGPARALSSWDLLNTNT